MALIQIKSSSSNASPQTLNVAEPAYSYVSNTLFIGTENSDGVIAIGGKFYLDQQQHIYDTANAAFTQANTTTGSLQTTLQNNINTVDARATAAFIQANAAFAVANSGGASQANAAFNTANAAFIQANTVTSVSAQANAAFGVANTALLNSVSASIYANGAFVTANAIDTKVTSASIYANGAFAQANVAINNSLSASNYANAAFAAANSVGIVDGNYANAAFLQANTAILNANTASIYANGAFIQSNVAVLNAAAASIYANGAFAAANVADNKAISSGNYANAAFAVANSAGVVSGNYANAAFTQANTAVLNAASASIYANGAFASANVIDTKVTSASIYANGAFVQANVAVNNALSASNYANGAFAAANTVGITPGNYANAAFLVANTAVLNANSASIYANGAFAAANAIDSKVNNASTYANGAFVAANTADAKAVTSGSYANSAFAQANAAFDKANTAVAGNFDPYARALSNTASDVANSALILAQFAANTANIATDTTADIVARNTANAAFNTANAAFNAANNSATTGNTINLGANTVGQLVSNAVTLTTTTKVTDGLALINNVLGKLVPASPPTFPGGTSLSINSLSTYRMTNFTQTDRTTTGGKSVTGGSTVNSVLRTPNYTTNIYSNLGPGDAGTLTLYKDNVATGAVTFTSASANGTYSDLIITQSKDYSTVSGGAAGFWRIFTAQGSGSTSNGWNEVYISHSGAANTSTASWYYDDSAPGSPTFTSASISPLSESLTYSSTIPHYNSSTTFKLGVNVAKLSGDMFPTSNTFFTGSAGGAFASPASNTYPSVGITYPLARNLYVSSGSVTVNTTTSVTTGFGSSSTGPSVTVDNSYSTASQAFTTALANTILYKTGTSSTMEESAVTFGSTVGTGSGTAGRIINPGSTDTPAYANNATLFNSQTGTLQTYDATIVAATLKHDQTNYASGYLPVGPNLSSGRTAAQYFTFKFVRTSLSKFNIKFTGTIAGLWVALPGTVIDSTSSLNGWLDMSTAYGGSGIPGANAPGNGSNGCALGGVVTLNSAVSAHSKTCTFGTISSSNSTLSEIYVRIKLTSGQTVTALSLETASN